MSIEITIKNNSFLKKELDLDIITNNELKYGHYENNIFRDGVAEDYIALYSHRAIGRGFTIEWKKGEKNQVVLHLPLPSTNEEITEFYNCVKRICDFWKSKKFNQDGIECNVNVINELILSNVDVSLNAIKGFIQTDEYCLPCALYPIYLDIEMMNEISLFNSLTYFKELLHEIQSQDYYFAKPMVYQKNDTGELFVRYAITEDTRTILPIKPFLPYDLINLEKEVGPITDFGVLLVSTTENKAMGEVPYTVFAEYIGIEQLAKQDARHKKYAGITLVEIKDILSKV